MFSFIFVRHEIFSPCKHLEFCHPEPRNGIPPHRHEIKIIPHCKIARGLLKSLKAAILKHACIARQASLPPLTRKGVRLHTDIPLGCRHKNLPPPPQEMSILFMSLQYPFRLPLSDDQKLLESSVRNKTGDS